MDIYIPNISLDIDAQTFPPRASPKWIYIISHAEPITVQAIEDVIQSLLNEMKLTTEEESKQGYILSLELTSEPVIVFSNDVILAHQWLVFVPNEIPPSSSHSASPARESPG